VLLKKRISTLEGDISRADEMKLALSIPVEFPQTFHKLTEKRLERPPRQEDGRWSLTVEDTKAVAIATAVEEPVVAKDISAAAPKQPPAAAPTQPPAAAKAEALCTHCPSICHCEMSLHALLPNCYLHPALSK